MMRWRSSSGVAAGAAVASPLWASMDLLLRGRALGAREGRAQRVPGERRALDAHRELAHAGEDAELAEVARGGGRARIARDEAVEALEEALDLGERAALHRLGHQGGRALRDRAAGALEADGAQHAVLDVGEDVDAVAAERI